MLTVYIAGPITGHPDYRKDFNDAAATWRAAGWQVVNPVELDSKGRERTWDSYMRRDLKILADCDAIATLPGWEASPGATLEVYVATALSIPRFDANWPARYTSHDMQPYNECCNLPVFCHEPTWRNSRGATNGRESSIPSPA